MSGFSVMAVTMTGIKDACVMFVSGVFVYLLGESHKSLCILLLNK